VVHQVDAAIANGVESAPMLEHKRGTGSVSEYCLIATAIGPVGLAWSETGITRLQLPDSDGATTLARLVKRVKEPAEAHPPEWLEPGVKKLQHYFAATRTDLSNIPLDLTGVSEFFCTIYAEMRTLGWGEIVTYGELAARVGSPGAAQAVGQAMGRNPVPIIVPCHRVLASGNKLGGFSAPGGTRSKLWLLDMEGVRLSAGNPAQQSFAF
jgi:methylated-DNA-[protein]-cysteine S-methyltransferase